MVVSKSAVKEYLERKLKNSSRIKELSRKKIEKKVRKIDPDYKPKLNPYDHQLCCYYIGLKYPSYLLFLDCGLGKTKIALDLFDYRVRMKQARRALVLVPYSSNITTWEDEIILHSEKHKSDIDVFTYMGFLRKVCSSIKDHFKISNKLIKKISKEYDFLVMDESTFLKNHRSLTFRVCRELSKVIPFRFCLTGTPFGKNPQDLWAQFFVIDQGETLGKTLGIFRGAFFNEEKNAFTGFPEYTFDKRKKKRLSRFIKNRSIRYSEKECLSLPIIKGGLLDSSFMLRSIYLPEDTKPYYEKLVKELREGYEDYKLIDNVFLRMRQLTSGFITMKDEDGVKRKIIFETNPKLEALVELVKEIPEGSSFIVFNQFIESGKFIERRLKKEGISCLRLYSKTSNKKQVVRDFVKGKARCLLSSEAGAYSLNLQKANYVIFYESPVSPTMRIQAEKRVFRSGQKNRVFIYDLVVKDSIDLTILKALRSGKKLLEYVISQRKKKGKSK